MVRSPPRPRRCSRLRRFTSRPRSTWPPGRPPPGGRSSRRLSWATAPDRGATGSIHADHGHPDAARRPAEVEPHPHPLAEPIDTRNRTDDLHERVLEVVLASRALAGERSALAPVVDPGDDAAVVALLERPRLVGPQPRFAHARALAAATASRRSIPPQ